MILEAILLHSYIFNNNSLKCHMFTAHNHNDKHEVDHPDTKANTGLHMVFKHISVKIV